MDYDQNVVYGKPSNEKIGQAVTKNNNLELKNEDVSQKVILVKEKYKQGESEDENAEVQDKIAKTKSTMRVDKESRKIHNMKNNKENNEFVYKKNEISTSIPTSIRKEKTDPMKSKHDDFTAYITQLDTNKKYNHYLNLDNKSPSLGNNTYPYHLGLLHNEPPTNYASFHENHANQAIQPDKDELIKNPKPMQTNPHNKNFEILFGQKESVNNHDRYLMYKNHQSHTINYPHIPYYFNTQNFPPDPYNTLNTSGSNNIDLNNSQQFNPFYNPNLNQNFNYYSATNPTNHFGAGNNSFNSQPYLTDQSLISNSSFNPGNGIAPYSCGYCKEIYKNSIFNNNPLFMIKCVYCQNVINNFSLDFYLKKYREDLVSHRKNMIKANDVAPYTDNFLLKSESKPSNDRVKSVNKENLPGKEKVIKRVAETIEDEDNIEIVEEIQEKIVSIKEKKCNENIVGKKNKEKVYEHADENTKPIPKSNKSDYPKSSNKPDADADVIKKVDDDWIDWNEQRIKDVKMNCAFTIPFNTNPNIKEKFKHKENKKIEQDEINSNKENTPSLSEAFKSKKADILNKLEKRKNQKTEKIPYEIPNNFKDSNAPSNVISVDLPRLSRREHSPRKEKETEADIIVVTQNKPVETVNNLNKDIQNKKKIEKSKNDQKKREEYQKRKDKQLEFAKVKIFNKFIIRNLKKK